MYATTPDMPYIEVTPQERRAIIEAVLARLCTSYVFPDVAEQIATLIRRRASTGDYDMIGDTATLAEALSTDLQQINHDGHLLVLSRPVPRPPRMEEAETPVRHEERYARARATGFGIARVERLAGNIGFIDLRGFHPPAIAGESVVAMMQLVAHTHALILDLRQHRGGDADMVALLCSYFVASVPIHLSTLHLRGDAQMQSQWTLPSVPGPRYLDRPVYLLASRVTVSAGEALAYFLKHLGRATVVGETTRGMANPGESWTVHPHLEVFIPTMRVVGAMTGDNWEGSGVKPDVEVPADDAYRIAYHLALRDVEEVIRASEQTVTSAALLAEVRDARQRLNLAPSACGFLPPEGQTGRG